MLKACPVLSVRASSTQLALAWFRRTHEVRGLGMGLVYRRRDFPRPGSLSRQDNWLTEALEHCRAVATSLLQRGDKGSDRSIRAEQRNTHDEYVREKNKGT